jgi:multicomponent Na+:H+ antiporter subunit B
MTEAALGACITTVVMLKLAIDTKPGYNVLRKNHQITGAISCLAFLSIMIFAGLDLPKFGDINTPIHQHVSSYYHENAFKEIGIESFVAAILASYRGFDTLGETLVIFTGGIAALFILSHLKHTPDVNFKSNIIIETCSKISVPIIILFVIYIQICGTSSPGGGFQAGAILASLTIGLNLSYGFIFDTKSLSKMAALGLLIYALPGMIAILLNHQFLDFNALPFGVNSQKVGIEIVELGICITVASTLTLLYYTFLTTKVTKVS